MGDKIILAGVYNGVSSNLFIHKLYDQEPQMMAELIHSAQSFMNTEDVIIAKKKKKGEKLESGYVHHSEQGHQAPRILSGYAVVNWKSKRNTFAQLKQRVANKLPGWKEKLLSNAGKEVFIKAVVQAVPSYTMSCFKLPNTLCEELTAMVRQFWWGQGWRLHTNSSSLFYRVYKAKYFPSCDFAEANMGCQPSFAWRSIMAAQPLVRRGMRGQVGDGNGSRFGRKNGYQAQDADTILSIPLSVTGARDRVIWAKNKNERFMVKNAYRLTQEDQGDKQLAKGSDQSAMKQTWRRLWQMKVPNKVKHFAWKACRNILEMKENLWRRNITKDNSCEVCKKQVESTSHLFWFCDHAKELANEGPTITTIRSQAVKWVPSQAGRYKVNVDGAVFSKRKQVGVGVVIRDDVGQVVAVLSKKLDIPLGPLETKAKAMEIGVSFAMEVRVRDVTFEGDSQVICNAIHGLMEVTPSVQNVVSGILKRAQDFRTFDFSHTKRQGNTPAHVLAHHAANVVDYVVWLEECPRCIERACMQDVLSSSFHE
ncbi:uncharacterized protein LOC142615057 [Castanea sativa]|uniref:uncharacterized protein LOC142615057 n=1 Tax=Castanea sativa TaxID=21020 RepID=UPI003F64A516